MSKPFSLPFRFEINAPISGVLKKNTEEVKYNKEIIFVTNRILKSKLKNVLKLLKNHVSTSPEVFMKALILSMKQSKKQAKISYLPYSVIQIHNNQTQVPKTTIFNSRVKSIKADAFLRLKKTFFDLKRYQITTVMQNRQNELLNHLIPKIEQKIYIYGFRKILQYSKQQKGKNNIIKFLQRLTSNISKRVYYSQFFNKIKKYKSKQSKIKLGLQKVIKIQKTNQKFVLESVFRKIQNFTKYLSLQKKVSQKKERISKIYDINAQRTVIIQKQRQTLRNLKYKLDHQAVQKNHVLTEKRRGLMLARTKLHQQSKQINDQIQILNSQVFKLQKIFQKQNFILNNLQSIRKYIKQTKRKGIDFEFLAISIYKSISDLMNQNNLNTALQIVRIHENRNQQFQGMPLIDEIVKTRQYICKQIRLLERIVSRYQKGQSSGSLATSVVRPFGQSLSRSQLKVSPSNIQLKGSRVLGNNNINRVKNVDPPEMIRQKQQFGTIQNLSSLILGKYYDVKIKQMMHQEIQQLSTLLANQ